MAAGEPLCVTADGSAEQEGGIIFADMPANMFGSFIMGLMQSGSILNLPTNLPVAWLPVKSKYQSWSIVHLAIRTGFCGALTTYSSWNSAMVIMIFGTGNSVSSQWMKAIFGFIIGIETSLGAYVLGKNVAIWTHRYTNPLLAREADILAESDMICINKSLPCFERRFLASISEEKENTDEDPKLLEFLEKWKDSTFHHRKNDNSLYVTIHQIEHTIIVLNNTLSRDFRQIAVDYNWDIEALITYIRSKQSVSASAAHHQTHLFELPGALAVLVLVLVPIMLTIIFSNSEESYDITRRTAYYATLFAPFGALLRWNLSSFNGSLEGEFSWFPVGTFAANLLGSFVSILCVSSELRSFDRTGYWGTATTRAIKVGFAGSLSTVSTFMSEISKLLSSFPNHMWGYTYIVISIGSSSFLGLVTYGFTTINL